MVPGINDSQKIAHCPNQQPSSLLGCIHQKTETPDIAGEQDVGSTAPSSPEYRAILFHQAIGAGDLRPVRDDVQMTGTARNRGLNTHQLLRRVCAEGLQGRPITPLPIDQPLLPKSS